MKLFLPAIVLLTASVAVPAQAGDVKLQVSNGRITLQARDATVREILAEWARVGQVRIVNADKMMGAPVSIELQDVPEAQALAVLLRSVSGYMAAPRLEMRQASSMYDRIVIMAAPRAAVTASSTAPTPQTPQYQHFRGVVGGMPNPTMLDDQDEPAAPPPTYPGGFPAGYPNAPRGIAPSGQLPSPTVPTPGVIPQGAPGTVSPVPTQTAPGQQQVVQPGTGAPGAVTQPPKKPGGPGGPGGED
jgi:hypothetical protein